MLPVKIKLLISAEGRKINPSLLPQIPQFSGVVPFQLASFLFLACFSEIRSETEELSRIVSSGCVTIPPRREPSIQEALICTLLAHPHSCHSARILRANEKSAVINAITVCPKDIHRSPLFWDSTPEAHRSSGVPLRKHRAGEFYSPSFARGSQRSRTPQQTGSGVELPNSWLLSFRLSFPLLSF
ncbi:hypothetical protein FHS90_003911 [Rufibacter quisquiliarum]|uniref:Uncharacterized protein n=1 Tax=Rufibacter quisquiliarum TaxID=1549639 RepID=A0A839GWQ3_9BACT|nr:hypothetical protein [Rufibacter quisquiliarum]